MAADRNMLVKALIRAAKVKAEAGGKPPIEALTDIIIGKFDLDFTEGRTVISTSEAGGSVAFATIQGLTPDEVLVLAEEAIERLEAGEFGDPANPTLSSRRIKRMRVSFKRAVTS